MSTKESIVLGLNFLLRPYFLQNRYHRAKSFLGKSFGLGLQKIYLRPGLPIYADFSDSGQRSLILPLLRGEYQASDKITEDFFNLKFLESVLKPGDVFLDVGSNIGVYAMCAARAVKSEGQVHCFEPLEDNLEILHKNIKISNFSSFVTVNNFGLLDSKSTFYFKKPKKGGHGCGMFVGKSNESGKMERVVKLETDTLDNYVQHNRINKIDFIKIDVEGAEMAVLKGGLVTLDKLKPRYFQIEFGVPHETSMDAGVSPQKIFSFFIDRGYKASYFTSSKKSLKYNEIDSVINNSPGKHLNVIFERIN